MISRDIANIKLVLAVLNRAALDCVCTTECNAKERREARWWVSEWYIEGPQAPWSFPWVCEHLGLQPEKTRDTILTFTGVPYEKKTKKHNYQASKGYGVGRAAESMFAMSSEALEYITSHLR